MLEILTGEMIKNDRDLALSLKKGLAERRRFNWDQKLEFKVEKKEIFWLKAASYP